MRRTVSPGFRKRAAAGLAVAGLAVLVTACTTSAPPTRRAATGQAPRTASVGQITAAAAGPIRPGTTYSLAGLKAAAPAFTVTPIETAVESRTTSAFGLFYDGMQTFQAFKGGDGKVGEVHGVGDRVVGPAGERIGMTMAEAGTQPRECRMGRDLWIGMAICTSHGARNVQLVYSIAGYMDFTHLPPPNELREAMLQRIIWRPN